MTKAQAGVEVLTQPWADFRGDLPDYDHPLRCVFESGVQYAVDLLAKELGVTDWQYCDGTEEFDGDLGGTLVNIVLAAMPKDKYGDPVHPRDLPALAFTPPTNAPSSGRETWWLIERRCSPPLWIEEGDYAGHGIGGAQTADVHRAHRYQTRRAAQEAMRRISPDWRHEFFVCEHIWIDGEIAAPSPPQADHVERDSETVIAEAIVAGIDAWKRNDEVAMDAAIAQAVRRLSWPVRGDDGRDAVIVRLASALDEHFPYVGCRDDLRFLVNALSPPAVADPGEGNDAL